MLLESKNIKSVTVSTVSPSICHEVMVPARRKLAWVRSSLGDLGDLGEVLDTPVWVTWTNKPQPQNSLRVSL